MPSRKQSAASGDAGADGNNGKEKETFGCPYPGCGQSYSRMEYLKRHQRKHQDDRPFACKDCNKAFARSDVLLRHRRRCHPTPPPVDLTALSPPQSHRNYSGMPVSSSRTDPREASPTRGRKHPRQASSSSQEQPPLTRQRTDDDEDEDEDFGEPSRFARNGMGNGGVYSANTYFNNTGDSSYTPHLLPMFQQTQPYNDSNQLDDASVLLSMAYGGSSGESVPTVQGQRVVADDWAPASTINMMMENAESERMGSVSSNGQLDQGTTSLPTNYWPNWLGEQPGDPVSTGEKTVVKNSNLNWGNIDPNFLGSMFSPSAFDLSSLGQNEKSKDDMDTAVLNILDQLAQYDVPQSQDNLNPERPLLRLDHELMYRRAGVELYDKNSKFYLPAERFAGCYQIPHWGLPPLRTLSVMANRTFDTVLKHFSMVHTPTFRLIDTAACLAFAICTVGGIKSSTQSWHKLMKTNIQLIGPDVDRDTIDGPLPPGQGWQSIFERNFGDTDTDDPDSKKVGEWESAHIVRNEKSNMLVKSFSLAKGVLMTEYNVALLQALVLYNAPYFLSEDENERALANMYLGTIVNIARQVGFFTDELEHFEVEVQKPPEPYTGAELDLYWRRWIQLETRRRTAYLIYHLDIVSALESHIPPILTGCELAYMPLPAPDSLWQATDAEEWFEAMKKYKYMTLDEAMRRIFFLPTYGSFDKLHERADTKFYNLLNTTELGPFARTAVISTLLRGVIDIGEGKRDRGDWRDLTDLWVGCSWLRPGQTCLDSAGKDLGAVCRESLRERFSQGLQRWREGWDFDPSCPNPGTSVQSSPATLGHELIVTPGTNGSPRPVPEACKLSYVEEALPFYWLASGLLNILNNAPPHEPGWNAFAADKTHAGGVKYGDMLKQARRFTRMGEGLNVNVSTTPGFACFGTTSGSTGTTPGSATSTGQSLPPSKIGVGFSGANHFGAESINSVNSTGTSGESSGQGNEEEGVLDLEAFEAFGGLDGILV